MSGYTIDVGYVGKTQEGKILFPTEEEYEEYMKEEESDD